MKTLKRILYTFLGVYCCVLQYIVYRSNLLHTIDLSQVESYSYLKLELLTGTENNTSTLSSTETSSTRVTNSGNEKYNDENHHRQPQELTPLQKLVKETLAEVDQNGRDVLPLPPEPTMGAFLHIGKTGGSTIQQLLRNGCSYSMKKPCKSYDEFPESKENIISKLTTYYHTNEFSIKLKTDDRKAEYKFFVITLRDPLQRAISSFLYSHPSNRAYEGLMQFPKRKRNGILRSVKRDMSKALKIVENNPSYGKYNPSFFRLYHHTQVRLISNVFLLYLLVQQDSVKMYTCFPSLEDWALKLENFTNYEWKEWKDYHDGGDCANVAKSTLHHSNPWQAMGHNYWDIRGTMWRIGDWADRTILTLRTEFLWQDWTSANQWLGEKGEIFTAETVNNSTDSQFPIRDKTLSEGARKNLCLALQEEYRLYWKLLKVSENLSDDDLARSMEISRKNCPWLDFTLPPIDEPFTMKTEGVVFRSGRVRIASWEF